jgi:LytTr DNA-binding domain
VTPPAILRLPLLWRDTMRGVMRKRALTEARGLLSGLLTRRLSVREFLLVAAAALTIGTIYCQIYCLLALQEMHGETMSIWGSVFRAGSDVLPALLLFEIGKHLPRSSTWKFVAGLAVLFGGLLVLAVAIRLQADAMLSGVTLRRVAVDRLPFLLGAVVALLIVLRRSVLALNPIAANEDAELLVPPVQVIDWVRAAGNYVEIHFHGRTKLLRATLRETAAVLPTDQFVQIHRSVIVNRARIEKVEGNQRVRMNDGATFTIGDAYRSNLRAA